jgi:hypothetical protein
MTEVNLPALTTGNRVAGIVPTNLDEMWRMAKAIVSSQLAPQSLNTPEKVLIAMQMGMEIGLQPMQALRGIGVVNGRPCVYGSVMVAVVRSYGHRFREWYTGEGMDLTAHCELTRADTGEKILSSFSMQDAQVAKLIGKTGPWQQYPKRMLMWRARGYACNDGAADALAGMVTEYEAMDLPTISHEPEPAVDAIAEPVAQPARKREAPAIEHHPEPEMMAEAEFTEEDFALELENDQ